MRTRRPALVLLVVMILVAGLLSAAGRDRSGGSDGDRTTTSALPAPAAVTDTGREVVAKLPSRTPVRARVGDTVVLRISSERPDIAQLLELGLKTSVGPALPGELRFVAQAPGSFPVALQVAGTTGGLVEVREAASE